MKGGRQNANAGSLLRLNIKLEKKMVLKKRSSVGKLTSCVCNYEKPPKRFITDYMKTGSVSQKCT